MGDGARQACGSSGNSHARITSSSPTTHVKRVTVHAVDAERMRRSADERAGKLLPVLERAEHAARMHDRIRQRQRRRECVWSGCPVRDKPGRKVRIPRIHRSDARQCVPDVDGVVAKQKQERSNRTRPAVLSGRGDRATSSGLPATSTYLETWIPRALSVADHGVSHCY
jgi:hypothetical protein